MPVRFASDTPALPSIAEELTDDPSPPIRARTGPDVAAYPRPNIIQAANDPRSPEFARMFRLIGTLTIEKIMADTAIVLDWLDREGGAGGSGPWVIA